MIITVLDDIKLSVNTKVLTRSNATNKQIVGILAPVIFSEKTAAVNKVRGRLTTNIDLLLSPI